MGATVSGGRGDYVRHGTLTLFAALNYLDGKIFRQTAEKHTHLEWLGFLRHLDREAPEGLTLHLTIDNYATHKHPKVKSWIKWRNQRHKKAHGLDRLVLHFTPTSSSWMNLVERFFRDLTEDAIREGSFTSVRELAQTIQTYLAERDLGPKRYVRKAEGAAILAKIARARTVLNKIEPVYEHHTSSSIGESKKDDKSQLAGRYERRFPRNRARVGAEVLITAPSVRLPTSHRSGGQPATRQF